MSIIDLENLDDLEEEEILENLNSSSINNFDEHYYCLLNSVIHIQDLTEKLLKKGANPNGITSSGVGLDIPFTFLHQKILDATKYKEIVKTLLRYRANINAESIEGQTLLTSYFTYLFAYLFATNRDLDETHIEILQFTLNRGINPNGTIFYNSFVTLLTLLKHFNNETNFEILLEMVEILLSYTANPLQNSIMLKISGSKIFDVVSTLDLYVEKDGYEYNAFKKLFELSLDDILDSDENEYIHLKRFISKCYKAPIDEIKTIIDLKQEFKTEETYDNVYNEEFISGASIYSVTKDEIVFLKQNNKQYCFHVSEIPTLLELRKNPFTKADLDEQFIEEILNRDCFPLITRDECFQQQPLQHTSTTIESNVLLEKIEFYIRTFNSYINLEKVKYFTSKDFVEIQNNIYDYLSVGDEGVINMFTVNCFDLSREELYNNTLIVILLAMRYNREPLPFISNLLQQFISESEVARDILSIFPSSKKISTIRCITNHGYNSFLEYIPHVIIRTQEDVDELKSNSPFKQYIEEKCNGILYEDDMDGLKITYRFFIDDTIREKLRDIGNPSYVWTDLIPSVIRQLS